MLVTLNDVIEKTTTKPYAVPAFNIFGYEDAKAVVDAAVEMDAPVILATNKVAIHHMPIHILGPLLCALAESVSVPVVVHLDHGQDYDTVASALQAGYSSVMYDGSQLSLEENIRTTKEIVKMGHAFSVSVEAEIGSVGYTDPSMGMKETLTDPDEAEQFYKETNVDALAIAVGTLHRMEVQTANLRFDLIEEIEKRVDIPLVMHGSTGIPDEDLKKVAQTAFGKVNIGTAIRMAFGKTLRQEIVKRENTFDRMELFQKPLEAVKLAAIDKIKLLQADKYSIYK